MSAVGSRRFLMAAVTLTGLALVSSGCAIDLSHLRPGGDETPAEEETTDAAPIAEAAIEDLANWPAAEFEGQMANADGENPFNVAMTVSDSGATRGSVDIDGVEATVLGANDATFVSANDDYWLGHTSYFNIDSDSYPDNWVRVPDDQFVADFGGVLTPESLAAFLTEQAPAPGAEGAVEDEVDGVAALRIPLSGGEMWVTEDDPHQILRIQVAELTSGAGGGEDTAEEDAEAGEDAEGDTEGDEDAEAQEEGGGPGARTDVSLRPLETGEIEEFYGTVLEEADELTGARDARMEINWDGDLQFDCETGGACTVSGTAQDTSAEEADSAIRVRMDASVTNDDLGEETCSATQTLEPGESVDLSCDVDFSLEPSTSPETYEVGAEGHLSTRSLSGDQVEDLVASLEEQRDATLERAGGGEDADAEDAEDDGGADDEGAEEEATEEEGE